MPAQRTAGVGTGFNEPLVHGQGRINSGGTRKYAYRYGVGMMPSAEFAVFHDDFCQAVATNVPTGWAAAIIDTGATLVADTTAGHSTSVIIDSDNGAEGVAIYLPKSVQLTANKRFFMEVRVKVETPDDMDIQFGLSDLTATTNPEDLFTTTSANLVAFGVLDGDATVGMLSDASNGGTSVQLGTIDLVASTWHVLGIGYDGTSLTGWVDGQLALLWSSASTTIPTGTALAPFIAARNGSAATNESQWDYVRYGQER